MNYSKTLKIIIGFVTIAIVFFPIISPFLGMSFIIMAVFISSIQPPAFGAGNIELLMPLIFLLYFPIMLCSSLLQIILQIFYVSLIIKNQQLTDTIRILFVTGTFFIPFLTLPAYFIIYFWNENEHSPVQQPDNITGLPA